jgi:hypothetical protein
MMLDKLPRLILDGVKKIGCNDKAFRRKEGKKGGEYLDFCLERICNNGEN